MINTASGKRVFIGDDDSKFVDNNETGLGSTETTISVVKDSIAALLKHDADNFDPVRFKYIEVLFQRSANQPLPVANILLRKTQAALSVYQRDIQIAQKQCSELLSQAEIDNCESIEVLRQLFCEGDYKAHKQLYNKSKNQPSAPGSSGADALTQLTRDILQHTKPVVSHSGQQVLQNMQHKSLALISRQQEQQTLLEMSGTDCTIDAASLTDSSGNYRAELPALQLLRESWSKHNAEQLVNRVIKEGPETPGPLNPEKLVIDSLTAMRDMSPDYLNRFVSYVDTLLWLEKAVSSAAGKTAKNRKKMA